MEARAEVRVVAGGDLTRCGEAVVAHQCNCTTKGARGLAKALFRRWPNADVYSTRHTDSIPGTILARRVAPDQIVVALFAQISPGKPFGPRDSASARLAYFARCLDSLGRLMNREGRDTVAMPYLIGCGLAGGDWTHYARALLHFAHTFNLTVLLYDIDRAHRGPLLDHAPLASSRPGDNPDDPIDLSS